MFASRKRLKENDRVSTTVLRFDYNTTPSYLTQVFGRCCGQFLFTSAYLPCREKPTSVSITLKAESVALYLRKVPVTSLGFIESKSPSLCTTRNGGRDYVECPSLVCVYVTISPTVQTRTYAGSRNIPDLPF